MAPQASGDATATLRAITFRISSTPTSQLPQQVSAISASLPHCKTLLSASSQSQGSKDTSEVSIVVHKYRTQLSTLIQDRSIQGRWAATVLIKATIEIGEWEVLQKSSPWVRGLLAILTKPDPPSSKRLSIIALTRIFLLTRDYPTLVREITTPSLPAFVQACLQLASSTASSPLLQTVIESFIQLLPRYPTVFRPYLKQIQQVIAPLTAPTPSNQAAKELLPVTRSHGSIEVSEAARQLWVHLHNCAPKSTSAEEWQRSITNVVEDTHRVANKVFRAVIEDWQPSSGTAKETNGHTLDNEVRGLDQNSMGTPAWSGLNAGSERMTSLLQLVKEHVITPTASTVYFRLSPVMDLLTRIFSLTVPSSQETTDWQQNVKLNSQVGRDEREALWAALPHIHIAAIDVLHALFQRFGASLVSIVTGIIDQLFWVYSAEKETLGVRTAVYTVLAQILELSGPTLPRSSIESLKPIIKACCNDLFTQDATVSQAKATPGPTKGNGNSQQGSTNADSFLGASTTPKTPPATFTGLHAAAHALLPVLLLKLPQKHISVSLRAKIDQTTILIQHREAMIASVLNPPLSKKSGKPAASIMPLVARSYADTMDVETLIRPRMPVIRTGKGGSASDDEDEEEEEEDNEANENNMIENGQDGHVAKDDIAMEDAVDPEINAAAGSGNERAHSSQSETVDSGSASTFTNPTKRSHTETVAAPPSPKRVRLESPRQDNAAIQVPISVPAKPALGTGISIQQESTSVPAPISNLAPPAASKAGSEDNDSDDDFGTLVVGFDSEDEDEEA